MKRPKQSLVPLLPLVAALALAPQAPVWAWRGDAEKDDMRAEKMTLDTLIVRPVSLAATVLGSVMYAISLPFSYTGGNQLEAQQTLVEDPARHTFQRPLGRDF